MKTSGQEAMAERGLCVWGFPRPCAVTSYRQKTFDTKNKDWDPEGQGACPAMPLTGCDFDSNTNLSLVYCPQLPGRETALRGPKVPSSADSLILQAFFLWQHQSSALSGDI